MKLTAQNVETILRDCFFREGEDHSKAVIIEGVVMQCGFHPDRLAAHKTEIKELLDCLPDGFQKDKGGGWSFLNACITKDGDQWGEHRNIDELLMLGCATQQAKILFPREMWAAMPGGMPYFAVGDFSKKVENPPPV